MYDVLLFSGFGVRLFVHVLLQADLANITSPEGGCEKGNPENELPLNNSKVT